MPNNPAAPNTGIASRLAIEYHWPGVGELGSFCVTMDPSDIVFVNDDGTVRELTDKERSYVAEPFEPFDSGRPYIKTSYKQKDGWGLIGGFCFRSKIPRLIQIRKASPSDDSNKTVCRWPGCKTQRTDYGVLCKEHEFEWIAAKRKKRWWQFWK